VTAEKEAIGTIRHTLRAALTGSLGTLARGSADAEAGDPYVSLVQVATRIDGCPILLLSTLAAHTQNALADGRVSLLLDGTHGLTRPLTGPRVTVQGALVGSPDEPTRTRYLARHPEAVEYVGFSDFAFYVMEPTNVHLVAGFGVIRWVPWTEIATPPAQGSGLVDAETSMIEEINGADAELVEALAVRAGGPYGPWQVTGIDPEGFDLRLAGATRRIAFEEPLSSRAAIHDVLARLARSDPPT
jgi:putative heme iron utilization protein